MEKIVLLFFVLIVTSGCVVQSRNLLNRTELLMLRQARERLAIHRKLENNTLLTSLSDSEHHDETETHVFY